MAFCWRKEYRAVSSAPEEAPVGEAAASASEDNIHSSDITGTVYKICSCTYFMYLCEEPLIRAFFGLDCF